MTPSLSLSRISMGLAVALGSFVALGTVAALWENPFFVRMTPAGDVEIVLLGVLSLLLGTYVAIRRPFCSAKAAGAGGVFGFIGVACPVCNKILLLLFGGDLLLTYFEPVRIYVAAAGVLIAAVAVAREWVLVKRQSAQVPATSL
ncbi:MAG: hypothetical protein ACE5GS_02465 [Kiloniellaceae bacterium]